MASTILHIPRHGPAAFHRLVCGFHPIHDIPVNRWLTSGANPFVGCALSAPAPAFPEETPARGCRVRLMMALLRFWGFPTTGRGVSLSTEPFRVWAARLVWPITPHMS